MSKGVGNVMSIEAPKASKTSYGSQTSEGGKVQGRKMTDAKPIDPKRYERAAVRADKRK
jgi:hypothetical protein